MCVYLRWIIIGLSCILLTRCTDAQALDRASFKATLLWSCQRVETKVMYYKNKKNISDVGILSLAEICYLEMLSIKLKYDAMQFQRRYPVHRAWSWASLKVLKDQTKVNVDIKRVWDFDVENLPAHCRRFLRSYYIYRQFDIGLAWKFIKVAQSQHQTCQRFVCGEHPCKVTTWYTQYLRRYCVYKVLLLATY